MAGKSKNVESSKPLELQVPKQDAETRLRKRVNKGYEITSLKISSAQDLEVARNQYYKWDAYNDELLKRQFTTAEMAEEYSVSVGIFMASLHERSLQDKVRDFHDDINRKIHRLDSIIERLELIPVEKTVQYGSSKKTNREPKFDKSKVFVVHGHDDSAKQEVARFIEKIGFEPIILHEQASRSKTIIEKIEKYSDVGFGVIIYTPCDVGAKNIDPPPLRGRARQNVVFEHGFLVGKLGRENVCSLYKGDVETLSDLSGVVYTPMAGNWQIELAKELRAAGYTVDMNKVI